MAASYRAARHAAGQRSPLAELPNYTNTPPQPRSVKTAKSSSPHPLPHNESYDPDGTLNIHHAPSPTSPGHKRISQITDEDMGSKRNSAISTASTTASGRKRKAYIGHWQLGKTIGKGGCSRVRAVRHRKTRQTGAVKIIARTTAESTRAQSLAHLVDSAKGAASAAGGYRPIPFGLEREIAIMKLLEHENIVKLYDVWENKSELYLIMEYVQGGELFHYVEQKHGLHEPETVFLFRQIISALLYCHRLSICHRDLKPENILLNVETMTVKLIDFGMAALQPPGQLLSTPCGSPHYAAPEVVSGRPYDGQQADVWSTGVILYVMLTGTTPFNYTTDGDIRQLFDDIRKANYYMPRELSFEAKDLIRKIFLPDPRRRITMDKMWDHALLHKYDKQFRWDGPEGTKAAAIGHIPALEDWKLKRAQDIDREILRNMRTLWHSVPEQNLVHKLLSHEVNQEKLFYAALVKHQEEQKENYSGDPDDMEYSASDYHHSRPLGHSPVPPLPSSSAQQSQSAYSIMNDEHLRSSHHFVESPPSISSYDPYRASRDPINNAREDYVNVVVHRRGSSGMSKTRVQHSLRHPNSLRIEMLKHGRRLSASPSASNANLARSGRSRPSISRSSMSHNSMTSSLWPSSPPIIATMRPSDVHKRNVSFNHVRKPSTTSGLASQQDTASYASPQTRRSRTVPRPNNPTPPASSSPAVAAAKQSLRSRKEKAAVGIPVTPQLVKVRKPQTPTQHMRSEIRKHSAELEKACEEAFFRASVGSSTTEQTSFSDKPSPYETPPSSILGSDHVLPASGKDVFGSEAVGGQRPLPTLPQDTPNSYLTKTLEETREKLAAFTTAGDQNSAKFDEVMRILENIMPASRGVKDRRAVSAPDPRTPEHPVGEPLPVIREESGDHRGHKTTENNWQRAVTSPIPSARLTEGETKNQTVRLVTPGSPGKPAPLNVRKRRGNSVESEQSQAFRPLQPVRRPSHGHALDSIEEHPVDQPAAIVRKKRSGWFGLRKQHDDSQSQPSVDAPDMATAPKQGAACGAARQTGPASQTATANPSRSTVPSRDTLPRQRFSKNIRRGKQGLTKWFHRRKVEDDPGFNNTSSESLFSTKSPAASSTNAAPPISLASQSWFARFLHIKPAVRVLCFTIPRSRARAELVILFKEWQRHGIQDLEYSRETNTITARVDKMNTLDIKPVTFRVELFVVLEHGRKVGLSIARFVQVKGAASGFRKVLEVVDGVMRGRDWLVEDEEKWKALQDIVS